MFEEIIRTVPIIKAPKKHRNTLSAIIITWSLTLFFIIGSIGFLIGYLTYAFYECQNNLVSTSEFTNEGCICSNNIGNSESIRALIYENSTFSKQFNSSSQYSSEISIGNVTYTIYIPYLDFFFDQIFPVIFGTSQVQNVTFNIFNFSSFEELFTVEQIISYNGGDLSCKIFINDYTLIYYSYYNVSCSDFISENIITNFNDVLNIDYISNPVYSQFCQLSSCITHSCQSLEALNIILLSISVISGFYSFLKVVKVLIFRIFYENEKIDNLNPS